MSFETTITDLVKESGITNIILHYKQELEWVDFIELHKKDWKFQEFLTL